MVICSVFLSLSFLTACGVFGDEVKSVSVMEGQNVTLHTDVIKQTDDKIVWTYGPENTLLARINGNDIYTMFSDDEMFKDRVKLNYQTGDLIITHITSQHSGLYKRKISKNMKVSYKTFNLTVYRSDIIKQTEDLDTDVCHTCSDSRPMRVIIIAVAVPLVICVIIIIFIFSIKHRRMFHKESISETIYASVSDKGSSSSSSSSEESNSSTSPDEHEKKQLQLY